MAISSRPARLPLYALLFAVSSACRCQYEVVLFHGDGGPEDAESGVDVDVAPATFTLTSETHTEFHGSDIGTAFDEDCAEGEVLIGYAGYTQGSGFDLVTGLQASCGRLELAAGATGITVVPTTNLPFHGEVSAVPVVWTCPQDQVIVGFSGNAGTAQDGMSFDCAPLTLSGGMVTVGAATRLTEHGGMGGARYDTPCPQGQLARGQFGSYMIYMQSFGLVCATPTPMP